MPVDDTHAHQRLLRVLVIGYWLIGSLDVGAAVFFANALPAPLATASAAMTAAADAGEWLLRAWMVLILVALIAGSLGIYQGRAWGRWLFGGANVVMFASYPLLDAMVYTWFGGLFADLSMVLTGAILFGAFWRPGES